MMIFFFFKLVISCSVRSSKSNSSHATLLTYRSENENCSRDSALKFNQTKYFVINSVGPKFLFGFCTFFFSSRSFLSFDSFQLLSYVFYLACIFFYSIYKYHLNIDRYEFFSFEIYLFLTRSSLFYITFRIHTHLFIIHSDIDSILSF